MNSCAAFSLSYFQNEQQYIDLVDLCGFHHHSIACVFYACSHPWIFPAKHCMGSSTDSYWFRAVKLYAITSLIVVVLGVLLNAWRNHWQTKMYNFHNVKPMTQIFLNNNMLNIIEIHAFTATVTSSWNFYLFFYNSNILEAIIMHVKNKHGKNERIPPKIRWWLNC